jgi:uncharacterized iron-regulated protein
LRKLLFMKRFTLAILFFPLMTFAQDKLSESNYRVFSVARNKEVTLKEIVKDMRDRDVLLFGEEHNDSVTHYLERTVLELLHAKYTDVALSMEMFDRDVQPVMDEYLHGFIREKHFLKDAKVWSNYKDYRPMVEFAKENGMDVICANAPTRYTNLAGRKGQGALVSLPEESKEFFAPLPYDTATGAYYAKLTGLPQHAAGALNDTAKAKAAPMMNMGGFNLVQAQSLWDATMAYSISKYLKKHKGKKVMQVNGKFHSDEGFAIATQLGYYSPKAEQLIVSTSSDEAFPNIKWDDYKKYGDFIIITDPKVPRSYKE